MKSDYIEPKPQRDEKDDIIDCRDAELQGENEVAERREKDQRE